MDEIKNSEQYIRNCLDAGVMTMEDCAELKARQEKNKELNEITKWTIDENIAAWRKETLAEVSKLEESFQKLSDDHLDKLRELDLWHGVINIKIRMQHQFHKSTQAGIINEISGELYEVGDNITQYPKWIAQTKKILLDDNIFKGADLKEITSK